MLPNTVWDAIKLLVFAAPSLVATAGYRILASIRGLPQDRVVDIAIFASALILCLAAYFLTRPRGGEMSHSAAVASPAEVSLHDKRRVLIVSPVDSEEVSLHYNVRGYVFPPDTSLQVLVYSVDGRWYLQKQVFVEGYIWSVECQFGNEQSGERGIYKLTAVHGDTLTERIYKTVPRELIGSNVVEVRRRPPQKPRCPEDWLHHVAELQRHNIASFIEVTGGAIRSQELSQAVPFIEFEFRVRNCSVFTLEIGDELDGFIEFDHPPFMSEHRLGGHLFIKVNTVKNTLFGNTGRLVIEQRLSKEEAKAISGAAKARNAKFKFGRLSIAVAGTDTSKAVEPKGKRIEMEIILRKGVSEL